METTKITMEEIVDASRELINYSASKIVEEIGISNLLDLDDEEKEIVKICKRYVSLTDKMFNYAIQVDAQMTEMAETIKAQQEQIAALVKTTHIMADLLQEIAHK